MKDMTSEKRIAVLVDVQNIYYTCQQAFKRNFNYNALWALISAQGDIIHASAYAIDAGDEKQRQFQRILQAIGFDVKLKPYIQRRDGSAKGDWDVGITLDALDYGEDCDSIVLLSGDGDFDLLVQKLQTKYQCQVEVIGVETLTANALLQSCDRFTAINDTLLMPG
ncbi:NYN domain-containing protein [Thalassotalea litorea]|nr:NYN domain-containing protein [Thalassotalea litorea]